MLARGRYRDAMELGLAAAGWLEENANDHDEVALTPSGMLHLRIAVAAARRGGRDTTAELLRRAKEAGDRLGRGANLWNTGFGPTDVVLHRFPAALDLGDVAFVVKNAPQISVGHMLSERAAATFHMDLARAYHQAASYDDALAALLEAEATAAPMVRHSVVVREMAPHDDGRVDAVVAVTRGVGLLRCPSCAETRCRRDVDSGSRLRPVLAGDSVGGPARRRGDGGAAARGPVVRRPPLCLGRCPGVREHSSGAMSRG